MNEEDVQNIVEAITSIAEAVVAVETSRSWERTDNAIHNAKVLEIRKKNLVKMLLALQSNKGEK